MGSLGSSTRTAKPGTSFIHFDTAFDAAGRRNDPEYRFCREMANELRTRPAGWIVWHEMAYRSHETGKIQLRPFTCGRYDMEAEAHAAAGRHLLGEAGKTSHRLHECWTTRVWIEREAK